MHIICFNCNKDGSDTTVGVSGAPQRKCNFKMMKFAPKSLSQDLLLLIKTYILTFKHRLLELEYQPVIANSNKVDVEGAD